MRNYELLYILPADVDESRTDAVITRIRSVVEAAAGTIDNVDEWGRRRLAYELDGHRDGHYTLVEFTAAPDSVAELERILRLDQGVLRHLLVNPSE